MSVAHAVTRNHVGVRDHAPLTVKGNKATFVVLSMNRLTVEKRPWKESFCDNPYLHPAPPRPQNNSLDRWPSKRTLKNSDKDGKV